MPSVAPIDKTSAADSGSLDSGSPPLSGTKATQDAMTTRLATAGPRVGPVNRRQALQAVEDNRQPVQDDLG